MRISIPRESQPNECRVAMTPAIAKTLVDAGFELHVETGAGVLSGFSDQMYVDAGAAITDTPWTGVDLVAKVNEPSDEETQQLDSGTAVVSLLWPSQNEKLIQTLAERNVAAVALDRIPRITRAQKMDVLSSMANIAGYRAVIEASNAFPRFFGGQITAAGKTPPARVLVIGAGVAGLAAIGAARGLGADVLAFDTRAAAREQVDSMGGRFLTVDIEESGEGGGGYAKVMSKEFIDAEMALFREHAPNVDIVITTALIPGKPAPKLWLKDMVERMPHGGVVVDLAAAQGGNCELTVADEVVTHNGVTIIGYTDLTSRLASHASQFFSRNVAELLKHIGVDGTLRDDTEDEILRSAMVTCGGRVLPPPPPREPTPAPKKEEPAPPPPAQAHPEPAESGSSTGWIAAVVALVVAGLLGRFAPAEFLQHFTVFVLAVFVGWQVVWNVTPALHTPLMSVTNAISGIILIGGMLQAGSGDWNLAAILGVAAILLAAINVFGGFLVTQRMLQMFRK